MATNIIMHQKEGISSEEINDSVVRLLKYRLPLIQIDNEPKFFCFTTGDGADLLDMITVLPIEERSPALIDEDWNILQLFDHPSLSKEYDKNVIWNPRLMPLDLCQSTILNHTPGAGKVMEMPEGHGMDLETMKIIQDKKLPFLELPMKWWEDDGQTEYMGEWFMGFNGNELNFLGSGYTTQDVEDYADKGGVWKYIEDKFTGVVLPTKLAQFTPYYLNDRAKNDDLNAQFEEKVRPYFPQDWYPPVQEDMDAPLFSWEHEWRDVSKQVRFIFLSGDDPIKSDMYDRLWVI